MLTLCYPPTPKSGWGVDEHTDLGFLTILNQDQIGGLEVKEGFTWFENFFILLNSHGMSWQSSKMVLTAEMSKIAQKFQDESFDAIKCSKKVFYGGNFTGNEPKNDG